jgi:hypothetical protein
MSLLRDERGSWCECEGVNEAIPSGLVARVFMTPTFQWRCEAVARPCDGSMHPPMVPKNAASWRSACQALLRDYVTA